MYINNILLKKDIYSYQIELEHCKELVTVVQDDRKFIYKLREEDIKKAKKEERLGKLKMIFIAGGSAVVGLGAGIVIGFFALR